MAGVEVGIKNLSKSFGSANIWSDVTLTLPAGEISALRGPSGTGKSVLRAPHQVCCSRTAPCSGDSAQMEAEMEELKKQGGSVDAEQSFIDPQINPTEGLGERKAVQRRKDRVMQVLHTLPEKAQTAILGQLTSADQERYGISSDQDRTELIEITRDDPPEDADPFGYQAMQENRSESMVDGSPAGEGDGEGSQAGSGDPNADAEARRAPPNPPEFDEPLVGVPVDGYAGGTVVLPQGGEHTKDGTEADGDRPNGGPPDRERSGPDAGEPGTGGDETDAAARSDPDDVAPPRGRFLELLHRVAART